MNAAEYRKKLKTGLSGPFLFCGEEEYMKRFCLTETRKSITADDSAAAFNIIRFSAAEDGFSFGRVADALSVPPFFSEKKLVELHDIDFASLTEGDTAALTGTITAAKDYETNIFIIYTAGSQFTAGSEKRRTADYRKFSELLVVVEFGYETPEKLVQWLKRHFAAENIAAGDAQCSALIRRCGCAMYTLSGETAKLCAYINAAGRNKLTESDIALVTCAVNDYDEFALSNAVLSGDTERLFGILAELKAKKAKPELILGTVTGVIRDLKLIHVLSQEGMTAEAIAAKTKMHIYKVGLYLKSLRGYGAGELDVLLDICIDTDKKIKSTGLDSYMLLDRMTAFLSLRQK